MKINIDAFIEENQDWYQEDGELVTGFEFASFAGVTEALSKLTSVIEAHNHHPIVTFGYNTLEIRTTTHDAGNQVTEKDLDLAKEISENISK